MARGRTLRDSKGQYAGSRGGRGGSGGPKTKKVKNSAKGPRRALTATQRAYRNKAIVIGAGAGFFVGGVGAGPGAVAGGLYARSQIRAGRIA